MSSSQLAHHDSLNERIDEDESNHSDHFQFGGSEVFLNKGINNRKDSTQNPFTSYNEEGKSPGGELISSIKSSPMQKKYRKISDQEPESEKLLPHF